MTKTMMRAGAALLAASSLAGHAWGGCVSDTDMAALKTAALQQELMVAAFSCHAIDHYNHFVRSHQPELIQSDARLKAYFVQRDGRRTGEASYHTYKTELANLSSLRSLRDDEFCDKAEADFDAANGHAGLSRALDVHPWTIEATYRACFAENAPRLTDVSATMPPQRTQLADSDPGRSGGAALFARSGAGPRQADVSPQVLKTPMPHHPLPSDSSFTP